VNNNITLSKILSNLKKDFLIGQVNKGKREINYSQFHSIYFNARTNTLDY